MKICVNTRAEEIEVKDGHKASLLVISPSLPEDRKRGRTLDKILEIKNVKNILN